MPILTGGRHGLGPFDCSDAGLLVDARDYYRAFFHAAKSARSYIALAGWQFDADVKLLRGEDAAGEEEVRLLPFLQRLCDLNPELRVHLLAWDFSGLYGLDRSWMQRYVQPWTRHPRIQLRFDTSHSVGGSHHQKWVLLDGDLAFLGGIDLCASRWDGRAHEAMDPRREDAHDPELSRSHGPSHDVQAVLRGNPSVEPLAELFRQRWTASGGGPIELRPVVAPRPRIEGALLVPAQKIWFSRSQGRTLRPPQEPQEEIRHVFLDAVAKAESLVYLENECFTSRAVYNGLVKRMQAPGRAPLEVVFVLPKAPESQALAVAQSKLLRELTQVAQKHGHRFGVYYSAATGQEGEEVPTFIHSKLLIVDDKFLTVGSANTTNRSMALDTELNLSCESTSPWKLSSLRRALRAVRVSLLAEHVGLGVHEAHRAFRRQKGLVAALDTAAAAGAYRLKKHPMEAPTPKAVSLPPTPLALPVMTDPMRPAVEDAMFELLPSHGESLFARGVPLLYQELLSQAVVEVVQDAS
jgi:phospholipase D1/2